MGTPSGDAPSVYNLLHRIWDVKDGSEKKGQYSISPVGKLAEQQQEQKEKSVRERTPPEKGVFAVAVITVFVPVFDFWGAKCCIEEFSCQIGCFGIKKKPCRFFNGLGSNFPER